MTFQLLVSFFLLTYNTGFCDEISVFVQTGDSVQLDIQTTQLPEFEDLNWINEKSETILKYTYKTKTVTFYLSDNDRVYFNNASFSLTLKNTQKTDSGRYTARISGKFNKDIFSCKVSVIDEVEAPVLAVNSNCSSSELSNFTCSGRNITVSSIYNSSSCPEEEETSADDHSIRMNCNDTFIMCNYSNPVSWKTDIKTVHEVCHIHPEKRTSTKPTVFPLWSIAVIVLATLGLLVTTSFCIYKRSKGYPVDAQVNMSTVYEGVDQNKKQEESPEMLEKTEKPVTVYHTIGEKPDLPNRANTTHDNNTVDETPSITENRKSAGSATIYCTIEKQPDQPKSETDNTIYSVVKKPSPGFESPKLN